MLNIFSSKPKARAQAGLCWNTHKKNISENQRE